MTTVGKILRLYHRQELPSIGWRYRKPFLRRRIQVWATTTWIIVCLTTPAFVPMNEKTLEALMFAGVFALSFYWQTGRFKVTKLRAEEFLVQYENALHALNLHAAAFAEMHQGERIVLAKTRLIAWAEKYHTLKHSENLVIQKELKELEEEFRLAMNAFVRLQLVDHLGGIEVYVGSRAMVL